MSPPRLAAFLTMHPKTFLLLAVLAIASQSAAADAADDATWQATYDARQRYFEQNFGTLPHDILKMLSMSGVWPGGGLYVIPAPRFGTHMAVYTTFGLSNPDMPTGVKAAALEVHDDGRRATRASSTLQRRTPMPHRDGAAGYGYEIIVIAPDKLEWPLGLLQWAVNAQINHDLRLLDQVEKYGGVTVEQVDAGHGGTFDLLIAKAQPPLPGGTQLPNGRMDVLVITTITSAEMRWAMEHGQPALLEELRASGIGQTSRAAVAH